MLNELARELGQPQIAKAPENQRIRLLLDALRPANALLILDNLESLPKGDRDRLFTFVKRLPQGCKAILTSRRRIGSGSEELILEQLSLNAALETLADLSRRNPLLARTSEAERIALYEQTAGKPLLLRWVAGQLGRGSCRTFSDASRFLLSCPPDNDPLEFIFGDLVKEFTTLETATLCALTYFSVPAKVEHIQALTTPSSQAEDTETRVPPESDVPSSPQKLVQIARDVKREFSRVDVETALSSLANRSLVVPDQEEKAFTLVPMVAEFLRNKRPETIAETGNRLEKRAFSLAIQNGGKKYARFHIIEDAWPTLAASLPRFISGSRARLKAICAALHDFLDFSGRWDEWLWLTQEAESKARLDRDWNTAGYQAYLTGYIHYMRGEALMVMKCASRATEYWAHAEPFWTRQSSILSLNGHLHRLTKNYPAAMAAYSQVINLAREHGSAENVATGLSHLAHAERESGDLDAAEHHYRESLELIGLSGSKESAAVATGRLADIALQRENWRGAEKLARAALELSETVGRKEIIAFDCRRLAEALLRQDRKAEALPLASRAVRMFAVLRSPEIERARATLNECEG